MARSTLTPQTIVDEGLQATYSAADTLGSSFVNDGGVFLHVKNAGASPCNVTITTGGTLMGEAVADKVVAVTNGQDRFIGPFPKALYNQPSGADAGRVYVDFSYVTSVTVALLTI